MQLVIQPKICTLGTQCEWVAQGSTELSFPNTSTHDKQWELIPKPYDLEFNTLFTRPHEDKAGITAVTFHCSFYKMILKTLHH